MDLSSAADELYGVPPPEFVATRTRLSRAAKAAGDAVLARRIAALRRPTLSAWAVNLLPRSAPGDLAALLEVGAALRAAWGTGSSLADLEHRRAGMVAGLVRTAGDLAAGAGSPLREPAVREVEDTLQAATVDADISAAVQEGRLTHPQSHAGFSLAFGTPPPAKPTKPAKPAKPAKPPPPERRGEDTRARKKAEQAAEEAEQAAEKAEAELDERSERAEAARGEAEAAEAEVARLRERLERAVAERDAARHRAERAERARDRARDAAETARKAARRAARKAAAGS